MGKVQNSRLSFWSELFLETTARVSTYTLDNNRTLKPRHKHDRSQRIFVNNSGHQEFGPSQSSVFFSQLFLPPH